MNRAAPTSWRGEVGRKGIHLASLVFPLALAFEGVPRGTLLLALAIGGLVAAGIEIGRRRSVAVQRWFLGWFGWMLRPHETTRLTGASWILLTMGLVMATFPRSAAIAALWAAVVGDTAAALVGRAVGTGDRKTWSGSIACAVTSAIGPLWLVGATFPAATLIGVAAAAAERPALRLDDNVRVAFGTGATAWVLLALGRFPA